MTELDLTPEPRSEPRPVRRRVRNWIVVGVVMAALAFVLFQALTSARVFFYNVDEAVAERDELGDRRFRMQGVVVTEPETRSSGAIVFTIAFNDVRADVRHVGQEPSDLFELGQAVVVEGHWEADGFESEQILVKHSESYVADNADRPGVGDGPVVP